MARYQKPIFRVVCLHNDKVALKSEWLGQKEASNLALWMKRMYHDMLYDTVQVINQEREVIQKFSLVALVPKGA